MPSDAQPITFETRGALRLRGDVRGAPSRPPVLLLHGGGQTRHAWAGSAGRLAAAGWRAVAIDLRGHGRSDWAPDGDYRIARFAEDVLDLAAGLGRKPVVVGASLGGLSALLATAWAPEPPFAACVFVDVTPHMRREGVEEILAFMAAGLGSGFGSLEEAADAVADYLPHRQRPTDLSGLHKNLRLDDDGRYRWHWDPRFLDGPLCIQHSVEEEALVAAARGLAVPTLLVRGRLSNLVTEVEAGRFLSLVPGSRLVDVSAAGHMVAGDRNDAFTAAILRFLEETGGRDEARPASTR